MSKLNRWDNWTQTAKPSVYLSALHFAGELVEECGPLAALMGVQQSKRHHPEGCAGTHCMLVCDEMATICTRDRIRPEDRRLYLYAALCHDFGKATTTRWNEKKQDWTAYGHDEAGVRPTVEWLTALGLIQQEIDWVACLVRHHMVHSRPLNQITKKSVRKLMGHLKESNVLWVDLYRLCEADGAGRPPLPKDPSPSLLELNRLVADEFPGEQYA